MDKYESVLKIGVLLSKPEIEELIDALYIQEVIASQPVGDFMASLRANLNILLQSSHLEILVRIHHEKNS